LTKLTAKSLFIKTSKNP